MGDVLVLSRRGSGGVRQVAELLAAMGERPVLVSERPDDPNRGGCAGHVVVDWDGDVAGAVRRAGLRPAGVVSMVESLIERQVELARRFGLPGGADGRAALASKTLVRAEARRLGLSSMRFAGGAAAEVSWDGPYPAIVKPARDSGASRLVRRAGSAADLDAHLRALVRAEGPGFEVIVEEYLDGIEFSVDGPVVDGRYTGLFAVEKPDHDEERHHDAGLRVAPPQTPAVGPAVTALTSTVSALCASLPLKGLWLHVEGRVLPSGRTELLEINPRPGGGLHRTAILRSCGVDPFWEAVRMALDDRYATDCSGIAQSDRLYGLLPFEIHESGRVTGATALSELREIDGVVFGYESDGFEVTSLNRENFYAEVLLSAPDLPALRAAQGRAASAFRYTVE